ncbi:MAG: EamA family transporter [Nocardioides sp.]
MEISSPRRATAIWMVLAGIASVQLGSAAGKSVFDEAAPTVVTWLRLSASAVILLPFLPRVSRRSRTWPRLSRPDWSLIVAFGVVLGGMNWAFYQSIARIPIGVAVTIEFLGPLAVAAGSSRRPRDLVWVALAGLGVVSLGFAPNGLNWAGAAFAALAGAAWAAYILLGARMSRRLPGISGLAAASLIAALGITPFALVGLDGEAPSARVLLIGLVVGLMSSAVPYGLETTALRSLPAGVFGILMSLEPAAAALAAALILRELLHPVQVLAIACVVLASVGATRADASQKHADASQRHADRSQKRAEGGHD